MKPAVPPLDEDLRSLLDAEREAVAPSTALDRTWQRLQATTTGGGARPAAGPRDRRTMSRWLVALGIGFVAGLPVGALSYPPLHRAMTPAPQRAGSLAPSPPDMVTSGAPPMPAPDPPAQTRTASVAGVPSASASTPRVAAPLAVSQPAATAMPSSDASSLKAERAVLDRVRESLSAGDTGEALRLVELHQRSFARPQLVEEREALAIQALVVGGRYDDARARAERFRRAFPNSLFLPAVQTSVDSIP